MNRKKNWREFNRVFGIGQFDFILKMFDFQRGKNLLQLRDERRRIQSFSIGIVA